MAVVCGLLVLVMLSLSALLLPSLRFALCGYALLCFLLKWRLDRILVLKTSRRNRKIFWCPNFIRTQIGSSKRKLGSSERKLDEILVSKPHQNTSQMGSWCPKLHQVACWIDPGVRNLIRTQKTLCCYRSVSYTHLTLPTKRIV